nr:hypothetical protein [Sporomusa acidovorans]
MLDGDFPVFLYLANLLGKTVLDRTQLFQLAFEAYARERERMLRPSTPPVLTASQQALAAALWQSIDQTLNGIPVSLDEYLHTLDGQSHAYRFAPERWRGLPFDDIRQTIVSRKELRSDAAPGMPFAPGRREQGEKEDCL